MPSQHDNEPRTQPERTCYCAAVTVRTVPTLAPSEFSLFMANSASFVDWWLAHAGAFKIESCRDAVFSLDRVG